MPRMESPNRTTTASTQLTEKRAQQLEDYCDRTGKSKSQVIREGIDRVTGSNDELENGRVPPANEDEAKAWKCLYRMTNGGGWVRQDRACSNISQFVPGYNKQTAYGLLKRLAKRGYIKLATDAEGQYSAVYVHE